MRPALDSSGYWTHGAKAFWPVGFNYWPQSAGVEMWRRWPEREMLADLRAMRALGFNSLRFFLRWQDFEPRPGRYAAKMEARLRRFLGWCDEAGLWAHPTVFVGWMSGGIFWPEWKAARNLYADPFLRRRSLAFVARAARVFRASRRLLAVDLGNEMSCLPDSHEAPPDAVRSWSLEAIAAVRRALPGVAVAVGTEQQRIFAECGFRFGDGVPWDFHSAHGYPVPSWNRAWLPGLRSTETQRRLPFYVKFARAFGPVMMQEFGTIATFGEREQREYVSAVLERGWRAGSNGFLWWCWKDLLAEVHPYTKAGIERTLGFVDDRGRIKPGLAAFRDFARDLPRRGPPPAPRRPLPLLLPREWYFRDSQANPGNYPDEQTRNYAGADSLAEELGREAVIAREWPAGAPVAVVPGACLRDDEIPALLERVRAGGRLLWWSPHPYAWGRRGNELLGAAVVDFLPPSPVEFRAWNRRWRLERWMGEDRAVVALRGARALAKDPQGRALLLEHRLGRGLVWCLLPKCRPEADPALAGERAFAKEMLRRFLRRAGGPG
jgi:hypothetical protein